MSSRLVGNTAKTHITMAKILGWWASRPQHRAQNTPARFASTRHGGQSRDGYSQTRWLRSKNPGERLCSNLSCAQLPGQR